MTIRVKVAKISFMSHAPKVRRTEYSGDLGKIHDGTFVWIGTPVKPGPTWTCGTDIVWPVLKLEGHDVVLTETPYVCRHMIEIGD